MIYLVEDSRPGYKRANRELMRRGVVIVYCFSDEWQQWGEYAAARKVLAAICRSRGEVDDFLSDHARYDADYTEPLWLDFPDDEVVMPPMLTPSQVPGKWGARPMPPRPATTAAIAVLGRAGAKIAAWGLPPSCAADYERMAARSIARMVLDAALNDGDCARFLRLIARPNEVSDVVWSLVEALSWENGGVNVHQEMVELAGCIELFLDAPKSYLPMFEEARLSGCSIDDLLALEGGWESAFDAWESGVPASDIFA